MLFGTLEYEFSGKCILGKNFEYEAKSAKIKNIFGTRITPSSTSPISGKFSKNSDGTATVVTNDAITTFKTLYKAKLEIPKHLASAAENAVKEYSRKFERDIIFDHNSIVGIAFSKHNSDTYWLFFDIDVEEGPIVGEYSCPLFLKFVCGKLDDYAFSMNESVSVEIPTAKIGNARIYNANLVQSGVTFFSGNLISRRVSSISMIPSFTASPLSIGKEAVKIFDFGSKGLVAEGYAREFDGNHYRLEFNIRSPYWCLRSKAKVRIEDCMYASAVEFYRNHVTKNRMAFSVSERDTVCLKRGNTKTLIREPKGLCINDTNSITGNEEVVCTVQNSIGRIEVRDSGGFNVKKASGSVCVYTDGNVECFNSVRYCRKRVKEILREFKKDVCVKNNIVTDVVNETTNSGMPFNVVSESGDFVKISWLHPRFKVRELFGFKKIPVVTEEEFRNILETLKLTIALAQ